MTFFNEFVYSARPNQEAGTLFKAHGGCQALKTRLLGRAYWGLRPHHLRWALQIIKFKSQISQALSCQTSNKLQKISAFKRFTLRGAISIQDHPPPSPSSDHELLNFAFPCSTTWYANDGFVMYAQLKLPKVHPKLSKKTSEYRSVTFRKQARVAPISHSRW